MASTISDAIKKDHREIESYYENIINTSDETEQVRWQNQFTWELARHSIGEELVVYPALEKYVSGGVDIANKDRQEHQTVGIHTNYVNKMFNFWWTQVKEQLKKFQNLKPSDSQFTPTLKALMNDLSQHIKEEEADDLPKLEEVLSQEESEKYSTSFGRTKMFVPSRSHPSAPDKPPYETVVGLLAAPIDHLSDIFRKWPHTSGMPNPSTK